MTTYVALLRAVNVGGTGKLAMANLRSLCEGLGFEQVQTYIASGNVVFSSKGAAGRVQAALAEKLQAHAGKPVGVLVRTAAEMAAVVAANPFPTADPKHTSVYFLDERPPTQSLEGATGRTDEEMQIGDREIYIWYPQGMGQSKLKLPVAQQGTARNMNTVAALAGLAAGETRTTARGKRGT